MASSEVDEDSRVSSLIDQDNFAWKVSLVKELFLPHEANMILGIPLSFRRPPDRIAWAPTPSSMFTTSSAYKLIMKLDRNPILMRLANPSVGENGDGDGKAEDWAEVGPEESGNGEDARRRQQRWS
nr:hypothetical protein CFP56_23293 [Quercus suber]